MSKTKNNNINNDFNRMMYKAKYVINETPKYKPISEEDFSNDDTIPLSLSEINEDEPLPSLSGNTETNTTLPAEIPQDELSLPVEPSVEVNSSDDIQNDIIKNNISAMQNVVDKLSELDAFVKNLNDNVIKINKEVEEVREPTTSEKLMSKKTVSYPYYFNLNDYWKGNAYEENEINRGGVKQLDDGTYYADFDDLDKYSTRDLNDSFNSLT